MKLGCFLDLFTYFGMDEGQSGLYRTHVWLCRLLKHY